MIRCVIFDFRETVVNLFCPGAL